MDIVDKMDMIELLRVLDRFNDNCTFEEETRRMVLELKNKLLLKLQEDKYKIWRRRNQNKEEIVDITQYKEKKT